MGLVFPGMKQVIVSKRTTASVKKQSLWARLACDREHGKRGARHARNVGAMNAARHPT